jgi:uncharacterized protein YbaA (DUF1428 family)
MKPRSLSASAAHVFELCPARYGAESFSRTPNSNNSAADLGSAVHNALERWCLDGHMTTASSTVEMFVNDYFDQEYDKLFGADISRLDEGRGLCRTWYERSHPITHEILSAEVKESFPIRVKHDDFGELAVPFNYIWDRCDRLPDGEVEVVDYKTIAIPLTPEQMREKIQVRAYALAAQVKYPDVSRVWVTYDMLRHGDPVGVSFTKEENTETYRYLQRLLIRILETDGNKLPEKVNDECRWCIRKQVCKALRKHSDVGGVHGITDPVEAAAKRLKMKQVEGALKAAIAELDGFLMKHMEREDLLEADLDGVRVEVTASARREVDAAQVKRLVPEEVWDAYGDTKISMSAYDKMMKDPRLSDEQRAAVKKLVNKRFSAPSIKTSEAT